MKNQITYYSIVIANANLDETRKRNLDFSIKFYRSNFPGSQIIVSDQVGEPLTDLPDDVLYLRIENTRSFSRSLAFNQAFKHCDHEWMILADNDCVLDTCEVEKLKTKYPDSDVYLPYLNRLDMTEEETLDLINCGVLPEPNESNVKAVVPPDYNNGCMNIISKKAFASVGGFDPQFYGWGYEDNTFIVAKCARLLPVSRSGSLLYHLNHRRTYCPKENPEWHFNRSEYRRIKSFSDKELRDYIQNLGSGHFN